METDTSTLDCGTAALYCLLKCDGVDIDFKHLSTVIPGESRINHTMQELADGAEICGVHLKGVQLSARHAIRPTSPSICFMNQDPHGHFIMIRPVGHSGKLVQVLDSTRLPEVMDWTTLQNSRGWSGTLLVHEQAVWPKYVAVF
jgi:ABC-type bacteriocin/lantibiotic exporter with double-glycine peptidase domain